MERINTGSEGWVHPDAPGYIFSSMETAEGMATKLKVDPALFHFRDDRKTLEEIGEEIRELEKPFATGGDGAGPWEEYFGWYEWQGGKYVEGPPYWPEGYHWLKVFVVTGTSEGYYLHVEADDVLLFLGKTLRTSPEQYQRCWESAARIAAYLYA